LIFESETITLVLYFSIDEVRIYLRDRYYSYFLSSENHF